MEIELSISVSDSFVASKSLIIHELSSRLNDLLKDKRYGEDVQKIKVGFIMVLDRPGYENWYKPRKLSYTDRKVSKSKLTGETIEINRQLSFELKLNENPIGFFLNADHVESQKFITQEILNYMSDIKDLPKRIKDFDKEHFLGDLKNIQDSLVEDYNYGA